MSEQKFIPGKFYAAKINGVVDIVRYIPGRTTKFQKKDGRKREFEGMSGFYLEEDLDYINPKPIPPDMWRGRMKAKEALEIFVEAFFFWSLIVLMALVFTYFIGEKNGRESVVCPEPHKLYGYIDKHGELVWDEFPEAAYETFYSEAVE